MERDGRMRAAVIEREGSLPVVGELERPAQEDGRVAVAVSHSTLNPMEIRLAAGRVGGPPEVPYAPGMEGVGFVLEGPHAGELARFECALPGHGRNGALAEIALAEPDSISVLPDGSDPALAAAIGVIGITAALALDAGEPIAGGRVAVLGASGSVGKLAVQLAKRRGARRVVAAARDPGQLERARELGADAVVRLTDGDDRAAVAAALLEAAEGALDVVVDPLWGVPGAGSVGALTERGRLVNVGYSAGMEEPLPFEELRKRTAAVIGMSSGWAEMGRKRELYDEILAAALAGELEVDFETVPLARIAEAWERQQGSPHAKLVIEIGGEA